jgi:hypothetical protein
MSRRSGSLNLPVPKGLLRPVAGKLKKKKKVLYVHGHEELMADERFSELSM